jgi:hypothetical protein
VGTDRSLVEQGLRGRLGRDHALGAFPFALGVAFALLALWALQERAQWAFVALVLLTLAASPLAFALLTLIAVGVGIAKRIEVKQALVPAVALAATAAFELALWRMFPDSGRYPFSVADLAAACAFSILGAALVWRIEHARALRAVLLVYGLACAAAYLIPSGLGSNITRLQYVAVPIAVLIAYAGGADTVTASSPLRRGRARRTRIAGSS